MTAPRVTPKAGVAGAEHARIFSAPMVRALRAGTKTMTRRLVTRGASLVDGHGGSADRWAALDFEAVWVDPGPSPAGNQGPYLKVPTRDGDSVHRVYPRAQPGDRLWVKETWYDDMPGEPRRARQEDGVEGIDYRATHRCTDYEAGCPCNPDGDGRRSEWRSPLFMPRWASRLTLEVTAVRFERLLDLTEEDARAEGVESTHLGEYAHPAVGRISGAPYRHSFFALWRELNGEDAWASNPWVTVTSFRVQTNGEG